MIIPGHAIAAVSADKSILLATAGGKEGPELQCLQNDVCLADQKWNNGQLLLRFAHMYEVDEHATLSQLVTFSLASVFSKAGLRISAATETMLTANQARKPWEARKKSWSMVEVVDRGVSSSPQIGERKWLDESDAALTVTLNAMEVKTVLVTMATSESDSQM